MTQPQGIAYLRPRLSHEWLFKCSRSSACKEDSTHRLRSLKVSDYVPCACPQWQTNVSHSHSRYPHNPCARAVLLFEHVLPCQSGEG